MSDEVTVDLFRSARGGASKWRPFVAALEPNIPVKTDMSAKGVASRELVKRYANDIGKAPIRFRVIDGTVLACWVVDSEQSK